jgi:hypothetical protein
VTGPAPHPVLMGPDTLSTLQALSGVLRQPLKHGRPVVAAQAIMANVGQSASSQASYGARAVVESAAHFRFANPLLG